MSPAVAALNIGVGPCWGETCGDMLEAMARFTPSQPNDAMARIASRRNRTISLDPNLPGQNSKRGYLDVDSKLFSKVEIDSREDWTRIRGKLRPPPPRSHRSAQFYVQPSSNFADFPCSAASFEVNSEPHIGARPSARLCVGLIMLTRKNCFLLVTDVIIFIGLFWVICASKSCFCGCGTENCHANGVNLRKKLR